MVDGVELSLSKPPKSPGEKTECNIEKFKEDVKCQHRKSDKCGEHEAKVFMVIRGQFDLSVKNELELDKDCETWVGNDDAKTLLNKIKESLCSTAKFET